MPLSVGDKLGHYEILGPLGAGGMGEVYRALDTQLEREVAIKVLPPALARDPERLARFDREAKVLAALSHSNIAVIYGLVDSASGRALVMELVPGETLGARIKRGAMPLEEALTVAKQIAEGLEAAHEKGIVHRDLKPGNVMITPTGLVKVLDFGLAAMTQPTASKPGDPDNSPTLTMGMTQAGAIMGTAAYMAPEQAAGTPVDRRADIWSYGVVLSEMLSGQRLFRGDTVAHTLAAVLQTPVDFEAVTAPRPIQDLLRRCLDRDVKSRLQWIGEARVAIQRYLADPGGAGFQPAAAFQAAPAGLPSKLPWLVATAALAVAGLVAGWALWPRPAELKPLVRLDLELDPPASTVAGSGPIVSPDGSRMVYVAQTRLYTRRLDQADTTPIQGTEGAASPFFSPDGQWVGFYSQGRLKKASTTGGGVVTISSVGINLFGGGAWGEDGNIISMTGLGVAPLVRMPTAGGKAEPLGKMYREVNELVQTWPQILPGGKLLLYTGRALAAGTADDAFTVALSLPDLSRKIVQRNAALGRYAALPDGSGYLLYVNHGTLFATPFDPKRQETRGTATPVLQDVLEYTALTGAQFDVSRTVRSCTSAARAQAADHSPCNGSTARASSSRC